MTGRQLRVLRDDAERLLTGERLLADRVPALIELAFVLVGPFLRNVVWRVGRTRREVGEEGFVRHQRLLLTDPGDRPVGQVLGQVIALVGRLRLLDRCRAVVEGRCVLVRLAAEEAIEVFEPGSTCGPGVERTHRARLPDRDLMAFAEVGSGIPIELEDLGQRCRRVRSDRGVAGRGGRQLCDRAHPDRVMVSAAQEGGARRGAQSSRVEARVLEAVRGEPFGDRRGAGATERAGRAKAEVIQQHDQDVRRSSRRAQRLDRRECRCRVLRVIGGQADVSPIGDRQNIAAPRIGHRPAPHFRTVRLQAGVALRSHPAGRLRSPGRGPEKRTTPAPGRIQEHVPTARGAALGRRSHRWATSCPHRVRGAGPRRSGRIEAITLAPIHPGRPTIRGGVHEQPFLGALAVRWKKSAGTVRRAHPRSTDPMPNRWQTLRVV